jgi:uncharacterized protein
MSEKAKITPPAKAKKTRRKEVPKLPTPKAKKPLRQKLSIGGVSVEPGQRAKISLPVGRLYTHDELSMPVEVLRGKSAGPRLFVSAALHGDEINGMEIVRRVLKRLDPAKMAGSLIAVPIINVFGFVYQSRYLPDRRDLNRSFPGSTRGSLAGRLAHLFLSEIVSKCTHAIDLHTAAPPRINLPHIRCNLNNAEARAMAEAFAPPVITHGAAPRGSLRYEVNRRGIPILLYEAGEPHRFNEDAIIAGVDGVLRVMAHLGMIKRAPRRRRGEAATSRHTTWVRTRQSGILHLRVGLGEKVRQGQILGEVSDPFGDATVQLKAPGGGLVVGQALDPLVHRGDAVVHLATLEKDGAKMPADDSEEKSSE